ncbi:probable E3 ubiquitin-protein ligase RHB1A isoform X1 [Rosa chinensis]|uniref:probable E3 ubiquitin-protein ligase RHB1A isoform X1 n=1 Tax=Rosa chinensis TaxID=74649 RepID=UPI000D08959E|nr:probable E3 ubiquitin-protein ligase RHB1A isoform X1 [Rosa chinensis]XP_024176188.1 probable E3 ubiquitin-protein ligase RHB1A isoform X1 [Rosa chinensis]XP_040369027.1 probable E3 ubiquitin-protein ligase RHB1A isoform X1 [Rosa chinensis]
MGGCCCSSRKAHLHGAPVYFYCSPALEEEESLTSHDVAASAITAGILVNLDLETSIPDTYRSPPTPLPYDMVFGCPQSTDSDSVRETNSCSSFETSPTCGDLEESDCKVQESSLPISPKKLELSKSNKVNVLAEEDEDVCPICLEEYETENPDFTTKCEHHYHLSCILEWIERSDACPICDQEVVSPEKQKEKKPKKKKGTGIRPYL